MTAANPQPPTPNLTSSAADHLAVETQSEEDTRVFGAELAAAAAAGDVLLLLGTFGVGKTTLVQGIGRGLGVEGTVNSPSFVIANEYAGQLPLYHVDLYRVEEMDQITLEALAEYFDSDGLCVVEWPASLPAELVDNAVRIELTVTGENRRRIALAAGSPAYRAVFERGLPVGAGSAELSGRRAGVPSRGRTTTRSPSTDAPVKRVSA